MHINENKMKKEGLLLNSLSNNFRSAIISLRLFHHPNRLWLELGRMHPNQVGGSLNIMQININLKQGGRQGKKWLKLFSSAARSSIS
jgi:hypothetical protein